MKAGGQHPSSRRAPAATDDAPLRHFSSADVIRIVGLSAAALRSLVRERHVSPRRGPRGAWRFTFQDLIALRTARALAAAGLPTRRISRALRELRRHLPEQLPLSGLSIRAGGEHVIVREAGTEWEGGSGQYLLALEVTVDRRGLQLSESTVSLPPAKRPEPRQAPDTTHADVELLFCEALEFEDADVKTAIQLYQRCLSSDAHHLEARINLARLLHEAGDLQTAEQLYLDESCRDDALAQFNLAVLLEDQGRVSEAIERYLSAVALDPALADAHYNLARLYDLQGNAPHTLRHLRAFQRLAQPPPASRPD